MKTYRNITKKEEFENALKTNYFTIEKKYTPTNRIYYEFHIKYCIYKYQLFYNTKDNTYKLICINIANKNMYTLTFTMNGNTFSPLCCHEELISQTKNRIVKSDKYLSKYSQIMGLCNSFLLANCLQY